MRCISSLTTGYARCKMILNGYRRGSEKLFHLCVLKWKEIVYLPNTISMGSPRSNFSFNWWNRRISASVNCIVFDFGWCVSSILFDVWGRSSIAMDSFGGTGVSEDLVGKDWIVWVFSCCCASMSNSCLEKIERPRCSTSDKRAIFPADTWKNQNRTEKTQ